MTTETTIDMRPTSFLVPISNISKNDKERRIVAGYASLDVIDRQGERITTEAMREAMEKFMSDPDFANTHVMHGNVAVGKVINSYIDQNDVLWETKVDETGTFIVSEIRQGLVRADQTWNLIEEGRLRSYSVGGLALSPKEHVCSETGMCHWEINEIEIHEFSYVDRPAVKGADFIIVKSGGELKMELQNFDPRPKAMACPIKKADSGEQIYKPESTNSDTIIMTDTPAEVSEVTDDTKQADSSEPEEVTEVSEETEKADVSPELLEIKAQNEKILNLLENITRPTEKMEFDYPQDHVKSLQDKYGEENTLHLLTILGDDYSKLLEKAETETEEAPAEVEADTAVDPDPEPVVEEKVEADTEEVKEEVPAPAEEIKTEQENPEEVPAFDKLSIIDEIQVEIAEKVAVEVKKLEEIFEQFAKVQKRSPVLKTTDVKRKSLLEQVGPLDWQAVEELAQRGA